LGFQKKHKKVAAEFVDENHFSRHADDANFFIDSEYIDSDDCIFLITREQFKKRISKYISKTDLKKTIYDDQIVFIDELRCSILSKYSLLYRTLLDILSVMNNSINLLVYPHYMDELINYYNFFENYSIDVFVHKKYPNGRSSIQNNSAILSSICHQNKSKIVGLQTRIKYSEKWEYMFDCYDEYYAWGEAWSWLYNNYSGCIRQIYYVGSLNSIKVKKALKNLKIDEKKIVVFLTEVKSIHYNSIYIGDFLQQLFLLAKRKGDFSFVVKLKDCKDYQEMLSDKSLLKLLSNIPTNIIFLDNERGDYASLIAESAGCICLAYTSPGVDSMIVGKPTIYYSKFTIGGIFLKYCNNCIASNVDELDKWISSIELREVDREMINNLDKHNDKKVAKRISRKIFKLISKNKIEAQ
jgi:hypothetical protein